MESFKTTSEWLNVFKKNVRNSHSIKHDGYRLTNRERDLITESIQDFQLGESSEGKTLRLQAQNFARKYNIDCYPELMNLFILEENRHSVYLARFMKHHSIPRKRQTFNDSIFRKLSHLMGIELGIRVLLAAEIIALAYYRALSDATESKVLKGICQHMLREEQTHTRFQMQHIQFMNLQKNKVFARISDLAHQLLIESACCAVWVKHGSVLKKRFTFRSFLKFTRLNFSEVLFLGKQDGHKMIAHQKESNHEIQNLQA